MSREQDPYFVFHAPRLEVAPLAGFASVDLNANGVPSGV